MKYILITTSVVFAFLLSCQGTTDCNESIYFSEEQNGATLKIGDTLETFYKNRLIAQDFQYQTYIQADTVINQDTIITYDTLISDKLLFYKFLEKDSLQTKSLAVGDTAFLGTNKINEDFSYIKVYLSDIINPISIDSGYALLKIWKGNYYSDCSSW